ncbi:hypothetical protein Tco_0690388, partial [Tanacetum coccineum]
FGHVIATGGDLLEVGYSTASQWRGGVRMRGGRGRMRGVGVGKKGGRVGVRGGGVRMRAGRVGVTADGFGRFGRLLGLNNDDMRSDTIENVDTIIVTSVHVTFMDFPDSRYTI